ncbi:MAG: hypothetical protein ACTSQG_00185 [Promethearchaeota archaeon]
MKIHIITPFYRQHLLPTLIKYLEGIDIEWHPVCDPVDIKAFENNDKSWVHPLLCPPLKIPGDQCYRKFNDFIDAGDIINEDYYGFMGDDDMFEPGFFDVIRQQTAKIIVYSNYRGNNPTSNHPQYPLIMKNIDDICVCNIGTGMYIVKGEILKQTKFKIDHIWDDGRYAENLKNKWPNDIQILPDLFIFGNYFEPGRFTSKENFIKNTWELPQII